MTQSRLSKLREFWRDHGWASAVERMATRASLGLFASGFHKRLAPLLGEMEKQSLSTHHSAADLLRRYFLPGDEGRLQGLLGEATALRQQLEARYASRACAYPREYAVHGESSLLLYGLVRLLQPGVLLETGVGNGHSSYFLLHALAANGAGTLHSTEIAEDAGTLLDPGERKRWQPHLLDRRRKRKSFTQVLEELPALDLFLHDSDHTYQWLSFELQATRPKLAQAGLMVVDDAEKSYAFFDFCSAHSLKPVLLFDGGKVLGLAGAGMNATSSK